MPSAKELTRERNAGLAARIATGELTVDETGSGEVFATLIDGSGRAVAETDRAGLAAACRALAR